MLKFCMLRKVPLIFEVFSQFFPSWFDVLFIDIPLKLKVRFSDEEKNKFFSPKCPIKYMKPVGKRNAKQKKIKRYLFH
jgi:predicted secreted protein